MPRNARTHTGRAADGAGAFATAPAVAARPHPKNIKMTTTVEPYKRRNWALRDTEGNLLCVTVYKCGARNLQEILSGKTSQKTFQRNDKINTHEIAELEP